LIALLPRRGFAALATANRAKLEKERIIIAKPVLQNLGAGAFFLFL